MALTTPFDPLGYLEVARELASGSNEARLRAAISRAYYAVFLIAATNLNMHQRKDRSLHKQVIHSITTKRGYRSIGDKLGELYELRRVADYQCTPVNPAHYDWVANWEDAEALVQDILTSIQRIRP